MKRVIGMSNPNFNYQSTPPYGVQSYMPQTGFNSPQYNGAYLTNYQSAPQYNETYLTNYQSAPQYNGAYLADLNELRNKGNAAITGLGAASLTFGNAATRFGTAIQGYGYK